MTRAFFIIINNRDFNSNKTVCKLYKLHDGYPSAVQDLIERLHRDYCNSKVWARSPDYLPSETIVKGLINDGATLSDVRATVKSMDYIDYLYEISSNYVKVTRNNVIVFKGSLNKFIQEDFTYEWREGMEEHSHANS